MFDSDLLKKDFPIFNQEFNGKPLIYLDNAATTQKPQEVIDSIVKFYSTQNANVARSSHFLGEIATQLFEDARKHVALFINGEFDEVVFTKNATEALNMVAFGWGLLNLKKGDIILTASSEHNSSLLPWKAVAKATRAELRFIVVDKQGDIRGGIKTCLNDKVKIIVLSHASNVLGSINPIKDICKEAKLYGAKVVVDGSQAVSHIDINVKSLGCDFYCFSGHKMMGPTGIGVLWGTKEALSEMSPISFGGGMVKESEIEEEFLIDIPHRFEAGTPNIEGAIALDIAIKYIQTLGIHNIHNYVCNLTNYAMHNLSNIPYLRILGPELGIERCGLVSFYIEGVHSHDISSVLSNEGIAVRSGMHCSMNLYKDLEIPSSTRASFYIYNTKEDVDALVVGVRKALRLLK